MLNLILQAIAILGINVFTVLFLLVAKWWKDFMSVSITLFFVIISAVLDLTVMAAFFPQTIPFVQSISVPALSTLAISAWGLVGSFVFVQFFRLKNHKGKVDVKVSKM